MPTSPEPAHEYLPGVHLVASLLRQWVAGTLHHGISRRQLDCYLDEFTFRFNRRTSRSRGLLFYRLLNKRSPATRTLWPPSSAAPRTQTPDQGTGLSARAPWMLGLGLWVSGDCMVNGC
jgi:hypothetical protein